MEGVFLFLTLGVLVGLVSTQVALEDKETQILSNGNGIKVTPVTSPVGHAEGPFWDTKNGVLYYVYIYEAFVYKWDPKTNIVTSHQIKDRNSVGTITPIKNKAHSFIISTDTYVYELQWDGVQNNTGKTRKLVQVEKNKPTNQFNDGKVDINGNIWLGTLMRRPDLSIIPNGGALYKFNPNKNFSYTMELANTTCSNGLTWTKDNSHMFYIDSPTRTVTKWDFDKKTSAISNQRVLFNLADHPEIDKDAVPDGMTVDADDNLFVALYAGSAVVKVHPNTGKLLQIIRLPTKYVTSVVFGGKNLDILYVTTSNHDLSEAERKASPWSGSVLEITGLKTKGLPLFEAHIH